MRKYDEILMQLRWDVMPNYATSIFIVLMCYTVYKHNCTEGHELKTK